MTRDKKSLPLLKHADKSMMPELLPPPPSRFPGAADPRERVRARLRQIGERAATLAAAVSLGASCASDVHNSDAGSGTGGGDAAQAGKTATAGTAANGGASGSVAQGGKSGAAGTAANGGASGGAGAAGTKAGAGGGSGAAGSAGTSAGNGGAGAAGHDFGFAGYGVVDPLPMPFLCGAATAATVSGARWDTSGIIVAVQLPGSGFGTNGNTIQSVSVDPSSVQTMVTSAGTPGMVLLKLGLGATWPASVMLDIAVNCMGNNGNLVWHVRVRLDTSKPALSGDVTVQSLASGADAGV